VDAPPPPGPPYPEPEIGVRVYDQAGVFAPETIASIQATADAIEARAEEIALLESLDTGQPIRFMSAAAKRGAENFRFFADKAPEAERGDLDARARRLEDERTALRQAYLRARLERLGSAAGETLKGVGEQIGQGLEDAGRKLRESMKDGENAGEP